METLLRNTTLRFSRRRTDHGIYEPLDQHYRQENYGSTSRRKVTSVDHEDIDKENNNVRSKRDRAKKRLIYLQSYKLGSRHQSSRNVVKSPKLKKAAVKVKSVAVSFVSFIRVNSMKVCRSKLAVSVFSPRPSRFF